jgi:hypothetical protein
MPIAPVRLKMRPIHGSQFYIPKYVDREMLRGVGLTTRLNLKRKDLVGSGSEENLAL